MRLIKLIKLLSIAEFFFHIYYQIQWIDAISVFATQGSLNIKWTNAIML